MLQRKCGVVFTPEDTGKRCVACGSANTSSDPSLFLAERAPAEFAWNSLVQRTAVSPGRLTAYDDRLPRRE
jgi:hypothetical protein